MRQLELQTQALHRKLKDQYQAMIAQNAADFDSSLGRKLEGSRLLARADFSLIPLQELEKIKAKAKKADAFSDYKLIGRPRRNSIDCLGASDMFLGPVIDASSIKPIERRQIVQNMRNVDKLSSELQELKINNSYLEK